MFFIGFRFADYNSYYYSYGCFYSYISGTSSYYYIINSPGYNGSRNYYKGVDLATRL